MNFQKATEVEQWLIGLINGLDKDVIKGLYLDEEEAFPITEDYLDLTQWAYQLSEGIAKDTNTFEGKYLQSRDEKGGFEGGGSEMYTIYSINEVDTNKTICYFKIEGYYDSWNGTSWDDSEIKLVKAVQVTVTQYVDI